MSELSSTVSARNDLQAWRQAYAQNAFDADLFFRRLLRRHLEAGGSGETAPAREARVAAVEERCRTLAGRAGAALNGWVMASNRDEHLPVLRRHDADGRPAEEVVFHPDYHRAGEVFWGSGALSVLAEPGNEVTAGALIYLLDQHGEAGHACPVACTAGAIKLLQQVGTTEQQHRWLPALLSDDYHQRLHGAQYVTEVQGGSDVGLNDCRAVPVPDRPGSYLLYGEKWFCSVADAGLFVVSARPEGAPAGTKGLALFLVPRTVDGAPNGFALRRLKYKLGTRSMATGEIDFSGAAAELIGPPTAGFKNLVGIVLDTSRVHNALAACGIMRRAFVEAHGYAARRQAFTRPILDYPAVQELVVRMRVQTMAGLATTFRLLALTDRIDTGATDASLIAARRIAVMINKYWTAVAATRCARDGIEVLGGNGTIEDFSVLPRLYRDAMVIESWEGTHNTLAAQVLRDFTNRGLHRDWLEELRTAVGQLDPAVLGNDVTRARILHQSVTAEISKMLGGESLLAAARIRHVIDRMCRLTEWVALLEQAQWERRQPPARAGASAGCAPGPATDLDDALAWYRMVELDRLDPLTSDELVAVTRRLACGHVAPPAAAV